DRLGRGLVGRFALVVEHPRVGTEGRGEVELHLAEHRLALGRGQQQVVGGEVEAVGGAEAVEVVGARPGGIAVGVAARRQAGQVAGRGYAGVRGDVVDGAGTGILEHEPPLRRGRTAVGQAGARHRHAGRAVLGRGDFLLLEVGRADEPARTFAAAAPAQVHAPGLAAGEAAVIAVVQLHAGAVDVLAGDDVDHAGDRVRAVDRRGA